MDNELTKKSGKKGPVTKSGTIKQLKYSAILIWFKFEKFNLFYFAFQFLIKCKVNKILNLKKLEIQK